LDGLPASVREELERSMARLAKNTGLELNLALNDGSRQEIVDAANKLVAEGKEITEESLGSKLYTAPTPDPDLVIRTSGEMRVSNFLLWQLAYAELYLTTTQWPDFREPQLIEAIAEFQRRHRRFGGL
jgi:undecaprenyl diphosphate synthase